MTLNAKWEWIVPFKGRNHSWSVQQNFLCRSGNVYVMDNHRAALWCWLQELDLNRTHSTIHIDRHYDALSSNLDLWLEYLPDLGSDIKTYLGATVPSNLGSYPIIRWDNYLSVYLKLYSRSINSLLLATHEDGDEPDFDRKMCLRVWDLPDNLSFWLGGNNSPWIVNVDLDYFYCDADNGPQLMVSDIYMEKVFRGLRDAMDRKVVGVVTLCLTPDSYTAGWSSTEFVASSLLEILGLKFALPDLHAA